MNFSQLDKKIMVRPLIIPLFLLLFYLATRLIFLTNFPMLNDESIYFYWALRIVDDPKQIMIPLSEGRQPLFIWLVSWYIKIFQDPILAGRLVSVSAGLVTMLGLFFVTKEVFKKHANALSAVALYIASPFALVYDRLALLDSLVTSFTIWSIYFTILLARYMRLDIAYTLGFIIGGGIITKSNGVFNLILLPFSLLLITLKHHKKIRTILHFVGLLIVVAITSQVVNSIITFSLQYSRILDVNQIFIIPKREFINLPPSFIINNFLHNFQTLMRYFAEYFTFPYLLLLVVSFLDKSFRREKVFLALYFFIPLFTFSLFGRQLLPRYIYFMTVSFFPLCGYGFILLYQNVVKELRDTFVTRVVFGSLILLIPAVISLSVIKDISTAFIPLPEKVNYTAGEHPFFRQSIRYVEKKAKTEKVFLVIEGYIGWAPNMYQVFLHDNKNITIKSYPRIEDSLPKEVVDASVRMPTFIIIPRYDNDAVPAHLPLRTVIEKKVVLGSDNTKTDYSMRMYEVIAASKL